MGRFYSFGLSLWVWRRFVTISTRDRAPTRAAGGPAAMRVADSVPAAAPARRRTDQLPFNTICKYAMGKTIGMGIAGRAACGRVRGAGMLT